MTWFVVGVCVVAAVVGLGVAARRRVLVVEVDGVSMEPTLHPDDRVVARRRPASRMRAGDVVVLREPVPCRADGTPTGPEPLMVKRLAAVPGDPYPEWLPAWARQGAVVPPDRYLVVGDNAAFSVDSRRFGPVSGDRLIGVAVRRVGGGPVAPAPAVAFGPVVRRLVSLPTHAASGIRRQGPTSVAPAVEQRQERGLHRRPAAAAGVEGLAMDPYRPCRGRGRPRDAQARRPAQRQPGREQGTLPE